jgi:hypothetical protein
LRTVRTVVSLHHGALFCERGRVDKLVRAALAQLPALLAVVLEGELAAVDQRDEFGCALVEDDAGTLDAALTDVQQFSGLRLASPIYARGNNTY